MTTNKNTESNQGDGGVPAPPAPPPPPDHLRFRDPNSVFKSGPLFISSKGIGWTSWKKRWFILTRTSLVFFRSDPSAISQKGSEVNLTLGGIDLNNSGSVVVKADKRLLTVLFPDGRDGRTFTLKAETLEDLHEWKTALEDALAQAPSAALVMGQNGIFKNDQFDAADPASEQLKDKQPPKSLVIGRPILLALEDVDGSPSFLEKALRFIEEYGIKVEGILRQAADVEDVKHRIREYEQGRTEFSPEEDAHVIVDCIKFFLRELPSSPVPASCCSALLEAFRTDRSKRVNAMRTALCETFPEPNRRLLQRILVMMQAVASHKAQNRMSTSAVAACMAPLLLRPLLAGDCEIETNIDVGGDGSIQLLQAAAAANQAQAIVITLLDEYANIFSEGSLSPGLYSDSEDYGSEDEEVTDDDESYEDYDNDYASQESDAYTDDDLDNASSGACTGSGDSGEDILSDNKDSEELSYRSKSPEADNDLEVEQNLSSSSVRTTQKSSNILERSNKDLEAHANGSSVQEKDRNESAGEVGDVCIDRTLENELTGRDSPGCIQKSTAISNGPGNGTRRRNAWGRTSARKNLSMESIDYPAEEEAEIQKLEASKIDLQNRISEEVKINAVLQANLEKRKNALHDRRLALERDVARLQEQLQNERDKRRALESVFDPSQGLWPIPDTTDEKVKLDLKNIAQAEADITNLVQKVDDLNLQLYQQREQNCGSTNELSNQPNPPLNHQARWKDKQKDTEATAASRIFKKYSSKERHDSTSSSNKHMPQNQQQDSARGGNSKTASTNSRKSGTRSEGANSTASALTKLTTRLNFLKERRTLIANELQNIDKGQVSGNPFTGPHKGKGTEARLSLQNLEKSQGLEAQSVQNPEKDGGSESSQPFQNLVKGSGTEGQSRQNFEMHGTAGSQSVQNLDDVNIGRSEGHASSNADKVQGSGDSIVVSPRSTR